MAGKGISAVEEPKEFAASGGLAAEAELTHRH